MERALEGVPFAGRTDRAIVADAMRRIAVEPTPAAIAQLREAYVAICGSRCAATFRSSEPRPSRRQRPAR